LIAAFNGIESMVEKLYSEYDSNLTVRPDEGKTFKESQIDIKQLKAIKGVQYISRAVEEIVVLKHEQKWANARMIGVDPVFLKMANVENHLVDGTAMFAENGEQFALIGATLLDKLGGFIPRTEGYESLDVYFPKRNAKISTISNPFRNKHIKIAGRVNFNKEVNQESFIIPLSVARDMLDYGQDITALYINVHPTEKVEQIKKQIQQKVGSGWKVKTHLEKNELIYQTSKSEKMIVIGILIFVFIMAAFNLVASLTMLFIEKKDNIKTMQSFGANDSFVFKVFFYEGLLISFKGVLFGLTLGYGICFAQIYGHIIEMPNSGGEDFPVKLFFGDVLLVVSLVGILSIMASYLPVKFLIQRYRKGL
jgi:lipoprotein-releasing system permease protein